jgi:hypothetical protein
LPVALSVSVCEFRDATRNGIARPPRFTDQLEYVIFVHDVTPGSPCGSPPPAGWESPGRFGWVDDVSPNCVADVDTGGMQLQTSNGTNWGACGGFGPGPGRLEQLRGSKKDYTVVLVPIVDGCKEQAGPGHRNDCRDGSDRNTLHVAGFAPFIVTGYVHTVNDRLPSWQTGHYPCTGFSDGCISGFFVGPIQETTDPNGVFGARSPSIVG